jgi:GNAT superfamily N-acetyltransferase
VADLVIRAAADNDIPAILDTLRAALGESPVLRRTPELWAWKHVLNPFGPSFVFVAVAGGGRIAGVRAMMRWRLVTPDGDVLTCVRPVDTATHPQYERRGIFRRLTMTALDAARAEGVHLVFNTPNDKSGPGYLRMGWEEVGQIGVLVRPRFGRAVRPDTSQPPSIASWAPGAVTVPASSMSQDREPTRLEDAKVGDVRNLEISLSSLRQLWLGVRWSELWLDSTGRRTRRQERAGDIRPGRLSSFQLHPCYRRHVESEVPGRVVLERDPRAAGCVAGGVGAGSRRQATAAPCLAAK